MSFSRATKDDVRRTFLLELKKHGVPCSHDQSWLLGSASFQAALDATLDELYQTVVPVEARKARASEGRAYDLYCVYARAAKLSKPTNSSFLENAIIRRGWEAVAATVERRTGRQAVLAEALYRVYREGAGLPPYAFWATSPRVRDGFHAVADKVNAERGFDAPAKTPGETLRDRWAAKHGYAPGTIDAWAELPDVVQEVWELQAAELEKARVAEAVEHFRFV